MFYLFEYCPDWLNVAVMILLLIGMVNEGRKFLRSQYPPY